MHSLLDRILSVPPGWVYFLVGLLVFVEDAIFVGFVVPGETAAVLGGVAASLGHTNLAAMIVLVVAAAIAGDSVGFEVGAKIGPSIMRHKIMNRHRPQLERASDFLAKRGGAAVFIGRWTAFLRAVTPALAGMAQMRYRKFLAWNALGGIAWGITFVVVGYVAGNSYEVVAKRIGRAGALIVGILVIIGLIAWKVRAHRAARTNNSVEDDPGGNESSLDS